jgi:outer membrane protein OmpA-like peptidoglycan-associated protein
MPTGDQDGDGLSDWEETRVYFTNPRMADSDGDGLTDKQEVQVYRTDPNKADSDGGGVNDGIEVQHGTLPLYGGDDVQIQGAQGVGAPGAEIALPVVNFPTGGAVVSAEDRKALDKAAAALKQYPGALVEIRGYTDNVGAPAANLKLSLLRAQAVADYLAGKGVEAWRLSVVGLGDKNPVAANGTPEGKAKNRRAELVLAK